MSCAALALGLLVAAGDVPAADRDGTRQVRRPDGSLSIGGLVDLGRPHYSPARTPRHEDIPPGGVGMNFRFIAHNPLIQTGGTLPRGGGGNDFNIVRNCGYAATKDNDQGIMILDVDTASPNYMKVIREMAPIAPGFDVTTDHIPIIESANLMIQTAESLNDNWIELWDTTDCVNPRFASRCDLPDTPHDLKSVWHGGNPYKILLIESFNSRGGNAAGNFPAAPRDVDLRIYDITDKYNPNCTPIAEWSAQQLFGTPVREAADLLLNGGYTRTHAFHDVNVSSGDFLSAAGFPTRIFVAAYAQGNFMLDMTPLATKLAGGASCGPKATDPNPCVKKLHPSPDAAFRTDPPWSHSNSHTFQKIPGRPYAVASDEPGPCPWGWLRFLYIGGPGQPGSVQMPLQSGQYLRGDLFPSQVGAFRIPENREWDCDANTAKFPQDVAGDESFNPHLHLIFPNIMFTSWNNAGLRAIDISDPGMPFEVGFYFPPPVGRTAAAGRPIRADLSLNNPPTLKDGRIYIMDRVNGVYVFEYTGPRSNEVPKRGLFTGEQNQVPFRDP